MDDDELDIKEPKDEEDFDDDLLAGGKSKGKKGGEDGDFPIDDEVASLDELAELEDGLLPEDSFDDDGADQW